MSDLLRKPLPPDIGKMYDENLANLLAAAQGAISGLNQTCLLLQNPLLLMRPILSKEAESSSQLEGTQASVEDAYGIDIEEQTTEKRNEAMEIRNYEGAMMVGMESIAERGLSNSVIKEVHNRLLHNVRGEKNSPGKYRLGEVWIGQKGTGKGKARYVPPAAIHVPILMDDLNRFIKSRGKTHPLIAAAMIHHRFEAIHPFEDGNGRVGRLLIALYLIDQNLLTQPVLYLSGHFEKNRSAYMNALSGVDKEDDWYYWLSYFLKAITKQANTSVKLGLSIHDLYQFARKKIEEERANLNLIRVLDYTFNQPLLTAPLVAEELNIPKTTAARYLGLLEKHKILAQRGTHKRQKVYANNKLLNLLRRV